ncbi:MAG: hypothetical protein ACREV1_17570 [Gammaproteobacteria bacterium]
MAPRAQLKRGHEQADHAYFGYKTTDDLSSAREVSIHQGMFSVLNAQAG